MCCLLPTGTRVSAAASFSWPGRAQRPGGCAGSLAWSRYSPWWTSQFRSPASSPGASGVSSEAYRCVSADYHPAMPPGELAVIIPAVNEAQSVAATVAAARQLDGVDIVVVIDDGSRDRTAAIAAQAGAHVTRHGRNRGKAAAMETGAMV